MEQKQTVSNHFLSNYIDDRAILQRNVSDHPLSPLGRFLLMLQQKKDPSVNATDLSRQSALYFNNQSWIQWQLKLAADSQELEIDPLSVATEEKAPVSLLHEDELQTVVTETTVEKEEIQTAVDTRSELLNTAADTIAEPVSEHVVAPGVSAEPNTEGIVDEFVAEDFVKDANGETEEDLHESSETVATNDNAKENQTIATAPGISDDDEESNEAIFEPLHTVDYFASQGIRIKEEALADDKLGQQVKSFTNWLKTMKKLHPGKLPEQNEVIERIIQSSAEQSNTDTGILTEAMAEVLIKQDKREKAVEMYEKLSLMNPSKSAYFAAKIERLKNH